MAVIVTVESRAPAGIQSECGPTLIVPPLGPIADDVESADIGVQPRSPGMCSDPFGALPATARMDPRGATGASTHEAMAATATTTNRMGERRFIDVIRSRVV